MQRELTFGPPPNEATSLKSSSYANPASQSHAHGIGLFESETCSGWLFIKRQPARRLWSPCCILSMSANIESQRLQARFALRVFLRNV